MSRAHRKDRWNISRARKRELLAFCRHYDEWKKELASGHVPKESARYNALSRQIRLICETAYEADHYISEYIVRAVTQGKTYPAMYGIPCGPDYYYDRRKKFLFLLDRKLRQMEQEEGGMPP